MVDGVVEDVFVTIFSNRWAPWSKRDAPFFYTFWSYSASQQRSSKGHQQRKEEVGRDCTLNTVWTLSWNQQVSNTSWCGCYITSFFPKARQNHEQKHYMFNQSGISGRSEMRKYFTNSCFPNAMINVISLNTACLSINVLSCSHHYCICTEHNTLCKKLHG